MKYNDFDLWLYNIDSNSMPVHLKDKVSLESGKEDINNDVLTTASSSYSSTEDTTIKSHISIDIGGLCLLISSVDIEDRVTVTYHRYPKQSEYDRHGKGSWNLSTDVTSYQKRIESSYVLASACICLSFVYEKIQDVRKKKEYQSYDSIVLSLSIGPSSDIEQSNMALIKRGMLNIMNSLCSYICSAYSLNLYDKSSYQHNEHPCMFCIENVIVPVIQMGQHSKRSFCLTMPVYVSLNLDFSFVLYLYMCLIDVGCIFFLACMTCLTTCII
jgi:hypothetical protein